MGVTVGTVFSVRMLSELGERAPERLAAFEDFIEFLRDHSVDRELVGAADRASEQSLAAIWDNPDDAAYDVL